MNKEQITAIAREYAEKIRKDTLQSFPRPLPESMELLIIKNDQEYYGQFLRWLSQRYCLVEKAKAKQFFQARQNILKHQNKYDRYIVDEASAEKRLMLCLFSDIAKEVGE